jgi:hypothetical protein
MQCTSNTDRARPHIACLTLPACLSHAASALASSACAATARLSTSSEDASHTWKHTCEGGQG